MMQILIIVATLILTGVTRGVAIAYAVVKELIIRARQSKLKKIRTHISNENYASIISLERKDVRLFSIGSDIKLS